MTFSIKDTQHNKSAIIPSAFMLSVVIYLLLCKCRHAECCYGECHGPDQAALRFIYTSDFRARFCIKPAHFREQKFIVCLVNLQA